MGRQQGVQVPGAGRVVYVFEFTIKIAGRGESVAEAWEDAADAAGLVSWDPDEPYTHVELIDQEEE